MKHAKRVYEIVHTEKVESNEGVIKIRVCAITDPEKYRLAKLNNAKPVRIERQISGNNYEVIDRCESISTAQEMLSTYIEDAKLSIAPKNDVTIFDI